MGNHHEQVSRQWIRIGSTTVPTQRNVFAKLMKSDEKILSCIPHNSAECFGIRISSHETQRVNRGNLHRRANSNQRASSNSAKCFLQHKGFTHSWILTIVYDWKHVLPKITIKYMQHCESGLKTVQLYNDSTNKVSKIWSQKGKVIHETFPREIATEPLSQ